LEKWKDKRRKIMEELEALAIGDGAIKLLKVINFRYA
jgi:hypothetical protein